MNENFKKSFKITNKNQFSKLVHLMETNSELARGNIKFGSSKLNTKNIWEIFAVELNSLGPPVRTGKEWQKVRIDLKEKVKRKIAQKNKDFKSTGGGPSSGVSLTQLEQSVDSLLGLQDIVCPKGRSFGTENQLTEIFLSDQEMTANIPKISYEDVGQASTPETDIIPETNIIPEIPIIQETTNILRTNTNQRLGCLNKQTKNQEKILEQLTKIEESCSHNRVMMQKIYELKYKKFQLLEKKDKREEREEARKVQLFNLDLQQKKDQINKMTNNN